MLWEFLFESLLILKVRFSYEIPLIEAVQFDSYYMNVYIHGLTKKRWRAGRSMRLLPPEIS